MIGRQGPAEYREARIAVADIKIAERLVVGAVFLDDKDDVLHASPDFSHPRIRSVAFRCAWQADIGSNLHRCVREHAIVGRRELQQACLLKLIDVLVRGAAGIRLATINGKLGCAALKIRAGQTLRLTTKMRRPPALVATALGYQPVGMSPSTGFSCAPGTTTASALIPPRVTSRRPSVSMARPLGLRPFPSGGAASAAGRASRGSASSFPLLVSTIASRSALSSVAISRCALRSKSNAVGSPTVVTRDVTRSWASVGEMATSCRSRGDETQAWEPSTQTIAKGNSPPGTPDPADRFFRDEDPARRQLFAQRGPRG